MNGGTARRLLAAMVREGLAEAVRDGGALRVRGPRGTWTAAFAGPDPAFPHPTDFPEERADPREVLDAVGLPYPDVDVRRLAAELASSVAHATLARPGPAPALDGPALAWEQAIVEGHPTHPCHRTRMGMHVAAAAAWAAECRGRPELVWVSVPEAVHVHGPFRDLVGGDGIPVHPGQLAEVLVRFPDARPLARPATPAWAQAALRTVCPDGLPVHLKLALAVQTTSALRTISPYSVANGPRISALAQAVAPPGLHVIRELASIGALHPDPDVARHLACIVRADPERELPGERPVVAAALTERDDAGVPLARRLPIDFARYAALLLDAVVPPMRDHGVALEAHGQNVLARFRDGVLVGFCIRDFGGVRIHRPTLRASGLDVELAPGSATDAADPSEVWAKLHHCVIRQHLGELIRALGLGDAGWRVVRGHVDRLLAGTPAHAAWTAPVAPLKCLLRMRLERRYRDYLYRPAPNPLSLGGADA